MPDRVIRCELLESEAWLSLKDNADRVAWLALALTVDNFGDMPAGLHRLARLWRPYGLDTPEKAAHTLSNLSDVDLVRLYEVECKHLLHLPRFRQRIRWVGRCFPLSPWATIEEKQIYEKKYPAEHGEPPRTSGKSEVKRSEEKYLKALSARVADPMPQTAASEVKIAFKKNEDQNRQIGKLVEIPKPKTGQNWDSPIWVGATALTFGVVTRQGEDFASFRDRVFAAVQQSQRQAD